MSDKLLDSIKNMYESLFDDQLRLREKIDENSNRISYIDSFLKAYKEQNESDKDKIHIEDMEQLKVERQIIDNDNQYYNERYNLLISRIETISSVLAILTHKEETLAGHEEFDCWGYEDKGIDQNDMDKRLYVLDIQEKERQRIARDLHDTSLQNLTHLVHKLELSSMYIDQDIIKAKLEIATINQSLKLIIQDIRNTIFNLRPMTFDDLGLVESFKRLIEHITQTSEFEIQSDIENIDCNNSLFLMTIYRIVEECMNNAVKHSGGNRIKFTFHKVEENNFNKCEIIVHDNGHSFNINKVLSVEQRHFGLCILKERVELLSGVMNIDSNPDIGTFINIKIPLLE